MKTIKKDECSYSVSNAIRTLAMVREAGLEFAEACKMLLSRVKKVLYFQGFSDFSVKCCKTM